MKYRSLKQLTRSVVIESDRNRNKMGKVINWATVSFKIIIISSYLATEVNYNGITWKTKNNVSWSKLSLSDKHRVTERILNEL